MTSTQFKSLAILTLTDPEQAAHHILAMRLPREAIWIGFALIVAINSLLGQFSAMMVVPDAAFAIEMPFVVAGMVLANVLAISVAGRILGGTGRFTDVMALFLWLQFLQAIGQGAIMVLALGMPAIEMPLLMGMLLFSLYLSLHLIKAVHGFDTLMKSVGTLLMSALLAAVVLTVALSMFGGGLPAGISNV